MLINVGEGGPVRVWLRNVRTKIWFTCSLKLHDSPIENSNQDRRNSILFSLMHPIHVLCQGATHSMGPTFDSIIHHMLYTVWEWAIPRSVLNQNSNVSPVGHCTAAVESASLVVSTMSRGQTFFLFHEMKLDDPLMDHRRTTMEHAPPDRAARSQIRWIPPLNCLAK